MVGKAASRGSVTEGLASELSDDFLIARPVSTTNRGGPRANTGEVGVEGLAAASLVLTTNTVVARREEDGDTQRVGLHELVVDTVHVGGVKTSLVASIRGRDRGRRRVGRGQVASKVGEVISE